MEFPQNETLRRELHERNLKLIVVLSIHAVLHSPEVKAQGSDGFLLGGIGIQITRSVRARVHPHFSASVFGQIMLADRWLRKLGPRLGSLHYQYQTSQSPPSNINALQTPLY